ncbi:cyclin-dependent kinase inhibitor 1D [Engraulis encrasicolus]|uniref:cyclin-dependent kinase inhibitor 1D n=1 Tax=Engraulis encrasicolus TaxID=184585 RepID=UPI002FD72744
MSSSDAEAASVSAAVPLEATRGRRGAVRRNLFGPVDHQQLREDFQRLLSMTVDSAARRWDFDFLSDRPVAGGKTDSALEWEELRGQDVPAFYRSRVVRRAKRGWSVTAATSSSSTAAAASPGLAPLSLAFSSFSSSSCSSSSSSSSSRSSSPSPGSSGEGSPSLVGRGLKRGISALGGVTLTTKRRQASITDFFVVRKRRRLHHKAPSRQ